MVVFREDKTYEEEIKTWQFWHSRQHSAKQRILEVDSKNSVGLTNLEELAHNAVQFYWNPAEGGVKVQRFFLSIFVSFPSGRRDFMQLKREEKGNGLRRIDRITKRQEK